MLRPYLHIATLSVTIACVTRTVTPGNLTAVSPRTASSVVTEDVQALVQLALTLDAAGDARADTLYAPDALVIGNAKVRLAAPRFAGIVTGTGRVTVSAANATVEGRVAWVLVDYTWANPAERRAEAGRATIILERRNNGSWKIVHAHSSQPLPWEQ
jgi:ketosteroid isomerase-like protein